LGGREQSGCYGKKRGNTGSQFRAMQIRWGERRKRGERGERGRGYGAYPGQSVPSARHANSKGTLRKGPIRKEKGKIRRPNLLSLP